MGVDTVAITEHGVIVEDFEQSLSVLEPSLSAFSKHSSLLRRHWNRSILNRLRPNPLAWTLQVGPYEDSEPEVNGPFGFYIWFGRYLCSMNPTPRWGAFVEKGPLQDAVQEVCEAVARCLGGKQIVYVPDSAYHPSVAADAYQELDMEGLKKLLETECGKPAVSISEIRTNRPYPAKLSPGAEEIYFDHDDGYFISDVGEA